MQANIVIVGATRGFETQTYSIPQALDGRVQPGHRVLAPLRSRKVTGVVTEVGERLSTSELKPILEVLEPRPLFDRAHLQLMEFLASYYMVSIADAYRSVIPAVARVESRTAYNLATPPDAFAPIAHQLGRVGLLRENNDGPWRRLVIEKPFGHDLTSARELNDILEEVFPPDAVFRIDHYLGKETVQNILALRFANEMYEPVWNRDHVDHVQITMAEDIGIGGRAGYYDGIGAARDVIQNHLLQLLALVAMEEPVAFDADSLRMEKEKVLSAVRLPVDLATGTARGQYAAGWQGGRQVRGFLQEDGIPPDSRTETYAALELGVDTRRWAGVPFYLRAGKRLPRRMTEIALIFHRAPHLPFSATDTEELGQNAMVIRIQPDEGITVRFGSKVPGSAMEVRDVNMDFAYGESFTESSPEAYERLILDVLIGDPPLFPRQEEVELSWRILDPIENFWAENTKPEQYTSGSPGPASADALMARDGRAWRRL